MVPPPPVSQPRCGNPTCGRSIERQATGRPARYCSGSCRQAVHRERVRLAEAERLSADRAVPDQYRDATQAAVLRAREHAAHQAASIPREVAGATAPLVTEQLTARAGHQGSPDGQTGQPASMPVIRDAGGAPDVPAASGTQAPRAWPPWAWTLT